MTSTITERTADMPATLNLTFDTPAELFNWCRAMIHQPSVTGLPAPSLASLSPAPSPERFQTNFLAALSAPEDKLVEVLVAEANTPTDAPAKRTRRTNAQIAADKAAAEARASQPVPEPELEPEPEADPLADGLADDPKPEPELEPEPKVTQGNLAPHFAKTKAIENLILIYGAAGGADAVAALQRTFGVNRFADIADERGPELLAAVDAAAVKLGVSLK
jgi:hypothetical protein